MCLVLRDKPVSAVMAIALRLSLLTIIGEFILAPMVLSRPRKYVASFVASDNATYSDSAAE